MVEGENKGGDTRSKGKANKANSSFGERNWLGICTRAP